MSTLAEKVAAYRQAYEAMKPLEAEIRDEAQTAVHVINAVAQEYKLYDANDWAFGWLFELSYVSIQPGNVEEDGIVFDLEDYEGYSRRLSFDVIRDPRSAAVAAAEATVEARRVQHESWQAARKVHLERELAKLAD